MCSIQCTTAGKFSCGGRAVHSGEVYIQLSCNVQFVEINTVLIEGDFFTVCNNDLVRGNIAAVGLFTVKGQCSGVFIGITIDLHICIGEFTIDTHVCTAVQEDLTGAESVTCQNLAVGIQTEGIGVIELKCTRIDFHIGCITIIDCQIFGIELGGIFHAVSSFADHTASVVDCDFGISSIAAEQSMNGSICDRHFRSCGNIRIQMTIILNHNITVIAFDCCIISNGEDFCFGEGCHCIFKIGAIDNSNALDIIHCDISGCCRSFCCCECIFADSVGCAIRCCDLAINCTAEIADVNTGCFCAEVLDIQIAVDRDKVESGKIFDAVGNGVFFTLVHDGGFAKICPAGGDQYEFSIFGNQFAENSDCADGGCTSYAQIAADFKIQVGNCEASCAQCSTLGNGQNIGCDISCDDHILIDNDFTFSSTVDHTAIVHDAASRELAVLVNHNGAGLVDVKSSTNVQICSTFNGNSTLVHIGGIVVILIGAIAYKEVTINVESCIFAGEGNSRSLNCIQLVVVADAVDFALDGDISQGETQVSGISISDVDRHTFVNCDLTILENIPETIAVDDTFSGLTGQKGSIF